MTWNYGYWNPNNHIIAIRPGTITVNGYPIGVGDYIGVFYSDLAGGLACGGYTIWAGVITSVTAYGDDPFSPGKNGFYANEVFTWKVWHQTSGSNGVNVLMTAVYDTTLPQQGNFVIGGLSKLDQLTGTYPTTAVDTFGLFVSQPDSISVYGTYSNPVCPAGSDGFINSSVSGGTSPYTFLWDNNDTTWNTTGLVAGTYFLTVTDSNSCTNTASYTLTDPTGMVLYLTGTDITCYGGSDGQLDLTVFGGYPPYSYFWQNYATTEDQTGIAAGNYSVTVTDAGNCDASLGYTLNQPSQITVSSVIHNVSCYGMNDGGVNVSLIVGTPPFFFLWSDGETSQNISSLTAGNYLLTVTDSHTCSVTYSYAIYEPSLLSISSVITNAACNGESNGAIDLTITGGTTPYYINWSNGDTIEDIDYLSSGSYIVTITDANYCIMTDSAFVDQPDSINTNVTVTNAICYGMPSGAIDLTVIGGTGPFSFIWADGSTLEDISNITSGYYFITVTDVNNCSRMDTVFVDQPALINANITSVNATCNGCSDGSVDVIVDGGTSPYTYNWNNGETSASIENLAAGTYSLTITDNSNCQVTCSVNITQPGNIYDEIYSNSVILYPNVPNPFCNYTELSFYLPVNMNVELIVFNAIGEIVETVCKGTISSGIHTFIFDSTDHPSGVYFCELKTNDNVMIRTMLFKP